VKTNFGSRLIFVGSSKLLLLALLHPMFYLVHKTVKIKFAWLNNQVLGHMVFDTEIISIKSRKSGFNTVFIPINKMSVNECVDLELRKKLIIRRSLILRFYMKALQSFLPKSPIIANANLNNDSWLMDNEPPLFEMTRIEKQNHLKILFNNSFTEESKVVGICLRNHLYDEKNGRVENLSKFNIRNVDATRYETVIEKLIGLGFHVVKLDKFTDKKFCIQSSLYFDYSNLRSDNECFDIRNCGVLDLCLSTGLGLDNIVRAFRKPVFLLDFFNPVDIHISSLTPRMLPKVFKDARTNRFLTRRELEGLPLFRMRDDYTFEKEGVLLEQNSSENLQSFAQECLQDLRNTCKTDITTQKWYETILKKNGVVPKSGMTPILSSVWPNLGI